MNKLPLVICALATVVILFAFSRDDGNLARFLSLSGEKAASFLHATYLSHTMPLHSECDRTAGCIPRARYLRLTNDAVGGYLQASEIEARDAAGAIVSRGKPCSSSSMYLDDSARFGCENLVDGVAFGFYRSAGEFRGEFAEIDLLDELSLSSVVVSGSDDDSAWRLEGQHLLLLDSSRRTIASFALRGVPGRQEFVVGELPELSLSMLTASEKSVISSNLSSFVFYRQFIPQRRGPRWVPRPGYLSTPSPTFYISDTDWDKCPLAAGEPGFRRKCNVGACSSNEAPPQAKLGDGLPRMTVAGEPVFDAVQRTLRAAWGPDPPQIDLYFRAGCGATAEIAYFLPTIELFWPDFLGEIIIALDSGNDASLDFFLPPKNTRKSYRFVYEDLPCMPGRVFNQVSYLNLDRHSMAQYVVTFDSDCILHSPVTPDLLFDERGKLLLPYTAVFQDSLWNADVEFFTGEGTFHGHSMMTQPVSFARETFPAYRSWMVEVRHECYFDAVTRHMTARPPRDFCWMCQLLTFLQISNRTREGYNLVDVDDRSESGTPYQRFALHVSDWENENGFSVAERAMQHGLCRAFGADVFAACSGVDRSWLDTLSFKYVSDWMLGRPGNALHLSRYIDKLRAAELESRPPQMRRLRMMRG